MPNDNSPRISIQIKYFRQKMTHMRLQTRKTTFAMKFITKLSIVIAQVDFIQGLWLTNFMIREDVY